MPVFEASSGSTAVSEAYFARMLGERNSMSCESSWPPLKRGPATLPGLSFTAVMSKSVSSEKIKAIEFYGGKCHLVETAAMASSEAERLAEESSGYFFNQFRNAEKVPPLSSPTSSPLVGR